MDRGAAWAIVGALGIVGLWFALDHTDPWPLNHETLGLGDLHLAHTAIGIVMLAAAFYVWRAKTRARA